ncbi:MAG: CarD family transcriptional regulator [Bryobacteraceae bacterium]|nr:CarD family transcriptional regulator [Bryobacteraceae bacterium]
MVFNIGEKVVYPNHGVCTIENISTRVFGARPERFYLLRLASSSMTVLVPFSHALDVGLRKITRNGQVEQILQFLAGGECRGCRDWKNRFKENSEKMRTGGLLEVAQVLKGLLLLQRDKPLSFREKKMLNKARHMLIMEVSISRALREGQAIELLQKALAKADLELPPPL